MYELTPYRQNQTIGDLMLRIGEAQAQGQMRKGDIIGNTVGSLGSIASGYIQDRAAEKAQAAKFVAEAPKRAAEAELQNLTLEEKRRGVEKLKRDEVESVQLQDLYKSGQVTPEKVLAIVRDPKRAGEIMKGIDLLHPNSAEKYKDMATFARDAFSFMSALPEPARPDAWATLHANLKSQGAISDDIVPATYSAENLARVAGFGQEHQESKPDTRSLSLQLADALAKGDSSKAKTIQEAIRLEANAGRAPAAPREPSYQAKDILNDEGKPVVANFDSKTGMYYGPDGKKIVNPQPIPSDRVAQDQNKFKKAAPVIKGISELSEKINTGAGLLAKLSGGAAKLAAQANYDDDVAEYESLVSGFTPMVARAVGHTGVLTEPDVQSVRKLFPAPSDSKTLRDRKMNRLLNIMSELETVGAGGEDTKREHSAPSKSKYKVTVIQ